MKPLFTKEQFTNAKLKDKLPLECYECKCTFFSTKQAIYSKKSRNGKGPMYCSNVCSNIPRTKKEIIKCKCCNISVYKTLAQIKKYKNHFCSKSCAATFNNTHKTHGTRRSKLEKYLEEQLITLYPNLQFDFNKKEAINSELDIYIPSLKLAFELNGIYHYEPIHGQDKLDQIQNNDHRKFQACAESSISLCVIDTSKINYFKPEKANSFLNIIISIIENKQNCQY
jgi:hypothetical protein